MSYFTTTTGNGLNFSEKTIDGSVVNIMGNSGSSGGSSTATDFSVTNSLALQEADIQWTKTNGNLLINQTLPKTITTGLNNISLGYDALPIVTTGVSNICIGTNSGKLITSGGGNVSVGTNALTNQTIGGSNIALGTKALENSTTSGLNVCVGTFSGNAITTSASNNNTMVGYETGRYLTTGTANVFIGATASGLTTDTTISNSVAIGANSSNANYSNSVVIGKSATNTSANQIRLGTASETVSCPNTLSFVMTNDNTAGTYYIPFSKTTAGTEGQLYVDSVTGPLSYNPSTSTLSFINLNLTDGTNTDVFRPNGVNTISTTSYFLSSRTTLPTGTNNICIGTNAGNTLTTGSSNTAIGYNAGSKIGVFGRNVFLGQNAGQNYANENSVFIGVDSGYNAYNGVGNSILGYQSGYNLGAGTYNTFLGYQASQAIGNVTLNYSTALGYQTNNANFSNSTAIGYSATNTSANQIRLGTASETVSCPNTLSFVMTNDNTAGTYYLPFSKSSAGTEGQLYVDSVTGPLSYNPSLSTLSCANISVTNNLDAVGTITASNFNSTSATVNVGIGATSTTANINIGSNLTTGVLNIASTGSHSGVINLGGNNSFQRVVINAIARFIRPIETSIVTPGDALKLGWTVTQATTGWTTSIPANTQTNITSISFTSANYGTYLFNAMVLISATDTTAPRQCILGINTTTGNYGTNIDMDYIQSFGFPMMKVSRVLNIYADTTVYLVGYILGSAGSVQTSGGSGIFTYTRIA